MPPAPPGNRPHHPCGIPPHTASASRPLIESEPSHVSCPISDHSAADQLAARAADPAAHLPVLLLSGPPELRHDDTDPQPLTVQTCGHRLPVHRNTVILDPAQLTGSRYSIPPGTSGDTDPERVMPLFCLAGEQPTRWRPYTLTAARAHDLLFVALDGDPVYGEPEDPATVRTWARDLSARHRRQLSHGLIDVREGLEIRHTYTITGEPGLWKLAHTLHLRAVDGDIPGWTAGHGDFAHHEDATHHLFTVRAPAAESGYLVCTQVDDRNWTVRRTWLCDTGGREELVDRADLRPEADLTCAIRNHFDVEPHWEGRYWRRRYTLYLESLHSGHIFAVDFDQCGTDTGHPDLHQTSIGYTRSRRVDAGHRDAGLLDDFDTLTTLVRAYLAEQRIPAVPERHSELTWLTRLVMPPASPQPAPCSAGGHRG